MALVCHYEFVKNTVYANASDRPDASWGITLKDGKTLILGPVGTLLLQALTIGLIDSAFL